MEIWFIYIIKTLLLPLSSLILMALFGIVFSYKIEKRDNLLTIFALTLLYVLSTPLIANRLSGILEKYTSLELAELNKFQPQAIVVIGGGVNKQAVEYGRDNTVNSRTLLRLRYAAYLAKQTELPVLVSGGSVFSDNFATEAYLMADALTNEFNIPVKWQEKQSRNTAENAFYTYKLLQKENIDRIVLVTHAIHMARAVKQFELVGFKVLAAPTGFFSNSEIDVFSFLPSAHAMEISSMAMHEWLGQLWYRMRYNKVELS